MAILAPPDRTQLPQAPASRPPKPENPYGEEMVLFFDPNGNQWFWVKPDSARNLQGQGFEIHGAHAPNERAQMQGIGEAAAPGSRFNGRSGAASQLFQLSTQMWSLQQDLANNKRWAASNPAYAQSVTAIEKAIAANRRQQQALRTGTPATSAAPAGGGTTGGTGAGTGAAAGKSPQDLANEKELAELKARLADLDRRRQEAEAAETKRIADVAARRAQLARLSSTVRGTLGGTTIKSGPLGALFGGKGVDVGPGVAQLTRGEVLGQPGSLLESIGLRTPSAQALSRMTPIELDQFNMLGMLAGVPEADWARDIVQAIPGAPQGGAFALGSRGGRRSLF